MKAQMFQKIAMATPGWDGSPDVWRAEDGAIAGESTPEKGAGTTYIIWTGGEPENFELKAEIKLEGNSANSGIPYRGSRVESDAHHARGNTMIHMINGHVMSIFIDDDPSLSASQGVIGLPIEGGGNIKISFRNLWLKNL